MDCTSIESVATLLYFIVKALFLCQSKQRLVLLGLSRVLLGLHFTNDDRHECVVAFTDDYLLEIQMTPSK